MPLSPRDRQIVADCASVAAAGVLVKWCWDAVATARAWLPDMMSDGLPLYLGAMTLRRGADPTQAEALAATYTELGLSARAHMFSTLYPASTGALLEPWIPGDWADFCVLWRVVLLASALVAGAAGGASGVTRRRWLAALLGAVATTVAFPTALTCARLGQVNQVLAALAGMAQLTIASGLATIGAPLLALGAGLKLVPILGLWPLLTAGRARPLAAGALAGLTILALTALALPLDRAVSGVLHTLRFESSTSSRMMAGLSANDPAWMRLLVEMRHYPLGALTALLAGFAGWRSRAGRPQALVGGVALVFAWLGADAAAQHALYLPLLLASLAWGITWPLAEGAPRWSVLGTTGIIAALAAVSDDSFGNVVAGEVVWLVVATRVLAECGPVDRRAVGLALALAALAPWLAPEVERAPPVAPRGAGPAPERPSLPGR